MKIRFLQSGGVTGLMKEAVLDTSTMSPDDARQVEQLVAQSGLPQRSEEEPAPVALSPGGRDLEEYEITIEDAGRQVSVVHDRSTLPQAVKPLVGLLKKYAKPSKP
jgi:emfourin